tara:strand:- start:386 stop:616 length:231 start_codon:yes stop_codon:yes gene_type:complete
MSLPFSFYPSRSNKFGACIKRKSSSRNCEMSFFGGERGIRTPGGVTLNGFQDRRIRPLCHFSAAKVQYFLISQILQ